MNPDESRNGTTKGTKLTKPEELGKALRSSFQVFRPISASSSSARTVAWFAVARVLRSLAVPVISPAPDHAPGIGDSPARRPSLDRGGYLVTTQRILAKEPATQPGARFNPAPFRASGGKPRWMAALRGGGAPAARAGRGLRARRSRARAPPRAGWHSEHRAGLRYRCWRERGRSRRSRRESHSPGRN